MKIDKKRLLFTLGKLLELLMLVSGGYLMLSSVLAKSLPPVDRVIGLIVGVWLLTAPMLENKLREIDRSLVMIATIIGLKNVDQLISHIKEGVERHGAKTGDGAKATPTDATTGAEAKG